MKTRNKVLIIVGGVALLLGGVFGGHYLYSENYKINVPDKITLDKPTKTLTTKGRGIYDTNGNNKADDTELIYTDEKTTAKKTTITLTGQTFAANGNYVLTAKLGAETNKPIQFTVDKLNKWDDETIVTINPAN